MSSNSPIKVMQLVNDQISASIDQGAWNSYVFDRTNPSGPHREFWLHTGGCRQHLLVTRDMASHTISSVVFARDTVSGDRS